MRLTILLIMSAISITTISAQTSDWKLLNGIYEHSSQVTNCQFSSDGKYFYTARPNITNKVFKYETNSGKLLDSVAFESKIPDVSGQKKIIKISRDCKSIIVFIGTSDYLQCEIFVISNGKLIQNLYLDPIYDISGSSSAYLNYELSNIIDYNLKLNKLVCGTKKVYGGNLGGPGVFTAYEGRVIIYDFNTKEVKSPWGRPSELFLYDNNTLFYNAYKNVNISDPKYNTPDQDYSYLYYIDSNFNAIHTD